jgi:hypothetical protein
MRLHNPARIGLAKLRAARVRPARVAKNGLALLLAAGAAVTTGGPAHADVAYSAAPNLPAISKATLTARYTDDRAALVKAAKEASAGGDSARAHTLLEMADPSRQILSFDPQGDGRAIEVVGDLATATRIAVVVPGAGNTIENFDSVKAAGGGSHAVYQTAQDLGASDHFAVIGWLGYDPPSVDSIHVAAEGHADVGAKSLLGFLTQVTKVNNASMTLLCHSYGSVVCGQAAHDLRSLPVTDIAVFGSPGMGVDSVSDLGTSARVWAGRGAADGIADVPHVQVDVLGVNFGFGDDPVDPAFGARIFDAGSGGHSDYLRLGSTALKNLTLISLGRISSVGLASGN